MIAVACSHCQAKLKIQDHAAGKRIRCPKCKQFFGESSEASVRATAEQDAVTEDATLPPRHVHSAADAATLPPQKTSAPAPNGAVTRTHHESSSEPAPLETETLTANAKYEVTGEIGRGGMGAIVRAVDPDIRREVAVKLLLDDADEHLRTRFVEEAQITGQLEHPNIVPIHQMGINSDGRCFFSMKMIKGRSLADILTDLRKERTESGKHFTLGRLLQVFGNICNAVNYAHSRGVIHRDLKPANVMVGDFGEVYVLDWGLAKVLGTEEVISAKGKNGQKKKKAAPAADDLVETDRSGNSELTQAGAVMGTPAYMPPEQAKGDNDAVDKRSDIYSLGAILYEILTLTPPVGREGDALAVMMRVIDGKIDPPETRAPQRARAGWIPPELSAIAMQALAKKRKDRYQAIDELQRDIELFLEGRSVSAKQDTTWEMFTKLIKRNKGASIASAAGVIVLTIVAGFFLAINYHARVQAERAREDTEKENQKFLKEQADRIQQGKDAVPSYVRAAKLAIQERQFEDAYTQAELALNFDPDHAEARLVKGQVLIVRQEYAEARSELEKCLKLRPDDIDAKQLADGCTKAHTDELQRLLHFVDLFTHQKSYALADGVTGTYSDNATEGRKKLHQKLLEIYRKRIDKAWPGLGKSLALRPQGFVLNFARLSIKDRADDVTDLSPLQGLPLDELDVKGCAIRDLSPLAGMRLTKLTVNNTGGQIRDLSPLKGMPIEHLGILGCPVSDLSPLTTMKLKSLSISPTPEGLETLRSLKELSWLDVRNADTIADLSPLQELPLLTSLKFISCANVEDLSPLAGMPLRKFTLANCPRVKDLSSLEEMKLVWISLTPKHLTPRMANQLKSITTLATIAIHVGTTDTEYASAEFWKKYDKGEFKK